MTNDLGTLGGVNHNATLPSALVVTMEDNRYRVTRERVENGRAINEGPVDGETFSSVHDCRAHLRTLRKQPA